ncbi:hypothetical protein ACEZCY_14245 [Streptacidiphilus sp. N1-12]|uniref:Uncharacterized protein n=2 Tax=Streptacidiphilus alkalitolerans TaxID=3342712 RepID=A0ABV6WEE7_9ACTN
MTVTDAADAPTTGVLTQYWQMPDGSVTMQTASPPSAMVAPQGGTEIDADTATQLLSQLAEAARLSDVAMASTQTAQAKDDYDVLIGLGMPDATARRLSQYTGGDS